MKFSNDIGNTLSCYYDIASTLINEEYRYSAELEKNSPLARLNGFPVLCPGGMWRGPVGLGEGMVFRH